MPASSDVQFQFVVSFLIILMKQNKLLFSYLFAHNTVSLMQPLQFKCACAPDLGENELLPGQANFHVDKQTDHTAARLLPVSKWRQQESNCRF